MQEEGGVLNKMSRAENVISQVKDECSYIQINMGSDNENVTGSDKLEISKLSWKQISSLSSELGKNRLFHYDGLRVVVVWNSTPFRFQRKTNSHG